MPRLEPASESAEGAVEDDQHDSGDEGRDRERHVHQAVEDAPPRKPVAREDVGGQRSEHEVDRGGDRGRRDGELQGVERDRIGELPPESPETRGEPAFDDREQRDRDHEGEIGEHGAPESPESPWPPEGLRPPRPRRAHRFEPSSEKTCVKAPSGAYRSRETFFQPPRYSIFQTSWTGGSFAAFSFA